MYQFGIPLENTLQPAMVFHFKGYVEYYDELPRGVKDGSVIEVLYAGNIGDPKIPLNKFYVRVDGRWVELQTNVDLAPFE